MFSLEPDMSKVALAALTVQLREWGFAFVDCQTPTDHTQQLGARAFTRDDFLDRLEVALRQPTRLGPWTMELTQEQLRERLAPGAAGV
jgi:leucyl/phenylalanyl-tRNA--protein transferase